MSAAVPTTPLSNNPFEIKTYSQAAAPIYGFVPEAPEEEPAALSKAERRALKAQEKQARRQANVKHTVGKSGLTRTERKEFVRGMAATNRNKKNTEGRATKQEIKTVVVPVPEEETLMSVVKWVRGKGGKKKRVEVKRSISTASVQSNLDLALAVNEETGDVFVASAVNARLKAGGYYQ